MKRALVVSAGSSKGAFSVGVIKHLVGDLKIDYNILCGVSAGSLIASQLGMFRSGEEEKASQALIDTWANADQSSIYKQWVPFGPFAGLWKSSIFNSQPLVDRIKEKINVDAIRISGKEVRVGATSLVTGEYRVFSQWDDNFIKCILASSAIPAALIPVEIDGELHADGAIKETTPIKSAIELGAETIDVVLTESESLSDASFKTPNAVSVGLRALSLVTSQIMVNDLQKAFLYNELLTALSKDTIKQIPKLANKRPIKINVYRPEIDLSQNPIIFSKEDMKNMIAIGYNTAIKNYKP